MYNGGKWTGWNEFKSRVAAELEAGNVEKAKVYVNDQKIEDGFILEGRVYVPLRATGEALDAKRIEWDNKSKTARLYK